MLFFDEIDNVNWLDVYACDDSCTDDLIENDMYDETDSLSYDSSNSPSFVTYTFDPTLELKPKPNSLKYVFLGSNETFPVIITSDISGDQWSNLLTVLREDQEAIGWTLGDIKAISLSIVQHVFHLEDNAKPYRGYQICLNPTLQEVIKKEDVKWLDYGITYPISGSKWLSLVQVVHEKIDITMIRIGKNELLLTRV